MFMFDEEEKKIRQGLRPVLLPSQSEKLSLSDLLPDPATMAVDAVHKATTSVTRPNSMTLDVPLPVRLRQRIDAQLAFAETKQELTETWSDVIRENRRREHLHFPLNPSIPSAQCGRGMSEFEQNYLKMISALNPTISSTLDTAHDAVRNGERQSTDLIPDPNPNSGTLEPQLGHIERAKKRSQEFFKTKKAAHQARIKSKQYRRQLAKERERELLKALSKTDGDDPRLTLLLKTEQRKKGRIERELARARERLTLKTRKAVQWATDMLQKRTGQDREYVLEQVRSKERLRQEILGKASSDSEEEGLDEEAEADGDNSSDIDHMSNASDAESSSDMKEITGDVSEDEEQVIGRRSFGGKPETLRNLNAFHNEDDDEDEDNDAGAIKSIATTTTSTIVHSHHEADASVPRTKPTSFSDIIGKVTAKHAVTAERAKQAFGPQLVGPVSEEFAQEKEAEANADAPQIVDLTLPGWGSWTGPADKLPRGHDGGGKVKVYKKQAGVERSRRKDRAMPHVIITEKRIAGLEAMQTDRVPFPFTSKEQYEEHLEGPLGREWMSRGMHRQRVRPRVTVTAGAIIKPIKAPNRHQ